MHTAADKRSSNVMGVALVAAAVGAVAGLLLAPKRGTEMREDLKGRYNDMKSRTQATAEDVQTKLADGVETASSKVKEVADKAKDTADEAAAKARHAKTSDKVESVVGDLDMPAHRRPRL